MTESTGIDTMHGEDGVLRITIDRADVGNSLSPNARDALAEAFIEAHSNPAVRAVLLRAAGSRHFCAGAGLPSKTDNPVPQALAENYIGAINGALNSLNMASDMKIPGAQKYTSVVLDTELARYLAGEISVDEALENIEEGWEEVTEDFGRDEQIAAQALALGS